jgi:hypothetical protein
MAKPIQLDLVPDTPPDERPRRGEYQIPSSADPGQCKSCGAPILWIRTPDGRPIPLSVATIQHRAGQRWALSHFSDCPEGKEWSKAR